MGAGKKPDLDTWQKLARAELGGGEPARLDWTTPERFP